MDSFEKIPEYAPKSVFGKILEVADVASLNEEERWEYDQALKHYRDYNNTLHTSYRQGKEEGILLMIRNMQEMGMDFVSIARIAKLSEEDVRRMLE